MIKLTIELDGRWVLQHRNDDSLPIDLLKNELLCDVDIKITDSSLKSITLLCDENKKSKSDIESSIVTFLTSHYGDANIKDILTIESEDVKKEASKAELPETDEDESARQHREFMDYLRRALGGDEAEGEQTEEESKAADDVAAAEKIKRLAGAAEFKALSQEIIDIAAEIKRTNTYGVFINQSYLFSIGDGCGLTTYLNLFADLISEQGLCKMGRPSVKEMRLKPLYKESDDPFEEVIRALEMGSSRNIRIFCIDISEWMDKTDKYNFKQFLRNVEKHSEKFIVVFRIPFVDKDILSRIKFSLSDLLSVRDVSFPPLGNEEVKSLAESELSDYNFTITDSAWQYFFERISEEKSDGKFYGVSTVKKVVRELIYKKHISNSKKAEKSNRITVDDAKALCADTADNKLPGTEQLNKLVGMDSIKRRIEEIIAQIELSEKDDSVQRPCIHMRFVGNPGTGKTTVARILGKILKEKGLLRTGAFFEYAGRDFCGKYIGETAPKTASICRDAYGSVLFIDEAYSLYRGDGDSRDYGREAIDTLIAEMENHRDDLLVIMAGYTDDINKLMSGNLGLASRMPYTIEFPNFTRDQLYDIFVSMVKEKFKYDDEIFASAQNFFENLPEDVISAKEFSNARYVRNLFERTWAKAAMRCQLKGETNITLTKDDFEQASADKEFIANMPKKTKMGFNS